MTPQCAWCESEATEQRHMGTRNVRGTWQRVYAWLCGECLRAGDVEREVSLGG